MFRPGIAAGAVWPHRSLTKDNTYGIKFMREAREYLNPDGSSAFQDRFASLADATAKARIDTAIRKLERGLQPDVRSVGEGVHEARIDYGPGYRLYFGNDGANVVILLLCGDKRTQERDIAAARRYWADYRLRKPVLPPPHGQR
jgi:putative addiction module killer protein